MLRILDGAVPEPDSEATSASTDLPLADSDAVMSPAAGQSAAFEQLAEIGAGQLELRRDQRRAVIVLGFEQAGEFAAVELAADVGQPDPVPGDDAPCMCASSRTPKMPAATEPNVRSSSAVNGIATFDWNGTVGQLPPRRLQAGIADHHGGDRLRRRTHRAPGRRSDAARRP